LNGELFEYYVSQFLVSVMYAGGCLVLDDWSAHKLRGILDSLIAKGVEIMFLLGYSSDFSSIKLV